PWYFSFIDYSLRPNLIFIHPSINLLSFVNDGLMFFFFLLVGAEVKREMISGELSQKSQILLPIFAAIGGMALPTIIYLSLNFQSAYTASGWSIPAATDIAFSLGILSLLGRKVPLSLKVFLTAVAVFDDLGAILIIAIFYHSDFSVLGLIYSL